MADEFLILISSSAYIYIVYLLRCNIAVFGQHVSDTYICASVLGMKQYESMLYYALPLSILQYIAVLQYFV